MVKKIISTFGLAFVILSHSQAYAKQKVFRVDYFHQGRKDFSIIKLRHRVILQKNERSQVILLNPCNRRDVMSFISGLRKGLLPYLNQALNSPVVGSEPFINYNNKFYLVSEVDFSTIPNRFYKMYRFQTQHCLNRFNV